MAKQGMSRPNGNNAEHGGKDSKNNDETPVVTEVRGKDKKTRNRKG